MPVAGWVILQIQNDVRAILSAAARNLQQRLAQGVFFGAELLVVLAGIHRRGSCSLGFRELGVDGNEQRKFEPILELVMALVQEGLT
jgi:hypothetical protein